MQDQDEGKNNLETTSGSKPRDEDNFDQKLLNKPNKIGIGFMSLSRRSAPEATNQWRTNKSENRFFGERATHKKQDENWRDNRCFGERTSSYQGRTKASTSNGSFNERKSNSKPTAKKYVTFDISELLLANEPDELVTYLVENLTDFVDFIAPPLPANTVVQIVFMVEKICLSKTNLKVSNVILSRLHKNFMKQLEKYFVKLSLDEEDDKAANELFWNNPEAFWKSLAIVFENVIDRLQKASTVHLDKVIQASLVTILFHKSSHGVSIEEKISQKLKTLNNRLANLKKLSNQTENECKDNYQTISLYPEPNEVLTRKRPFLRQNIIDGSYMSVEHYLDTQFRLLREDFLGPLREAICTYKDSLINNERVNITEFRVYSNTVFLENYVECIDDPNYDYSYIGNRVRQRTFQKVMPGICNKKFVNNEEAFMPGTLLCFSSNSFKTMFFGITAKLHGTMKGVIDVQLLEDVPFLENKEYTMLECCNYFSIYYLVLKSLQNFNTYNFPMEKYIVNVVNNPQPPRYLKTSTIFKIDNLQFTVLNDDTWPTKEQLKLNEMQYAAFKQALQSQCAIIQGPPGTGKTHLGLKIAQTLIQNNERDNGSDFFDERYESDDEDYMLDYEILNLRRLSLRLSLRSRCIYGPILVVAYTNHALDQFLEGLMPFTKNIIRIGFQGKNDQINRFRFLGSKRNGYVLKEYYRRIEERIIHKNILMSKLESVLSYGGIFNIKQFTMVIPTLQNNPLKYWTNRKVIKWLLGDSSTDQNRRDRWEMANELAKEFEPDNATNTPYNLRYGSNYILELSHLQKFAAELKTKLDFKDVINMETIFENWYAIEESYKQMQDNIEYLKWRLQNAKQHVCLYATNPVDDTGDLLELPYNDRWILYFHWLDSYAEYLKNALKRNNSTLQQIWEELEDWKQREDSDIIGRATVIGMTTSGAAKNRHLLENLKCSIVIVEEAAEVLESHIIISLTHHCQHLILIGDHQQLRPNTSDYEIEKKYQLGISLFERLVRNKITYSTLNIQHRMQPEISRLIVPSIYENLENHPSVNDFPDIQGIKHNVFFITHSYPEEEIGNSRKNLHEAKYVIALARHLILQGNDPSEITILTTYKGQMYAMMDEQKNSNFSPIKKVQIIVVDNFQGEENQIILLSLVRSNNQGSIGFLRIENRVCVALSRAKKGFYMIGNMEILINCSKIWPKVNDVLEQNQQIGPGLELACQLHPQHVTIAIKPEDFLKVSDGGCHLPCNANLVCGHECKRKCHVTDLEHEDYQCMKPCNKILCLKNHRCLKKCWETCGLCQVPIEQLLPCGHEQLVPCSINIDEYKCPVLIETLLMCNHVVDKPCFENKSNFKCPIEIEAKKPICGHLIKKKCFEDVNDVLCVAVIMVKLNCGHDLEARCLYGNTHANIKRCQHLCLQKMECGHICKKLCHYYYDKTHSTDEYRCKIKCTKLQVGCKSNHKCNLLCSEPCQPCRNNIYINLPCGHSKLIPCHKSDKKYGCNQICKKTMPCGHVCYKKCHGICDSPCFYKVFKSFSNCGHKIKMNCSEDIHEKNCMKCLKKKSNIQ